MVLIFNQNGWATRASCALFGRLCNWTVHRGLHRTQRIGVSSWDKIISSGKPKFVTVTWKNWLIFSVFYTFPPRFQKLLNDYDSRNGSSPQPSQRLVLMVVDALRDDFLDRTDNLPYVSGELKANRACRLSLTVDTPTVTMPRIKVILFLYISLYKKSNYS